MTIKDLGHLFRRRLRFGTIVTGRSVRHQVRIGGAGKTSHDVTWQLSGEFSHEADRDRRRRGLHGPAQILSACGGRRRAGVCLERAKP